MASSGHRSADVMFFLLAVSAFMFVNLPQVDADAVSWNYLPENIQGPKYWYVNYSDCGGVMQSPINIDTQEVLYDRNLDLFDFSDYKITEGVELTLENVGGHTAEVLYSGTDIFLRGGSLPDDYQLEQFHFHWGQNSRRGSEHGLDGAHFPMEVHFVHRQKRLPNVTVAAPHPFGLAVVGFFFKVVDNDNVKYNQLLDYFGNITNASNADAGVVIPTFSVYDLLPESKRFDYFRYQGSLTTPPCYESVIWSIGTDLIEISEAQVSKFRALYDEEHHQLVDDYRPVQELKERTVLTTHLMYKSNSAHFTGTPQLATFLLPLLLMTLCLF
ncbi:hypothetical protein BsWGS_21609 [Bradybaena similaris]